jgi:hypothetical protein
MAELCRSKPRGLRAWAGVWGLVVAGGCRIEPDWAASPGAGGAAGVSGVSAPDTQAGADEESGGRGAGAAGGRAAAAAGGGRAADAAAGNRAPAAEGGMETAGAGAPADATGGGMSAGSVCAAQRVELGEIARREVRDGVRVELEAVATSQKFLLSHAKSGSCLWGVFAGAEPEGDEPRGVLAVSFGEEAPGDAACRPGTDAIPDVTAPGERVRIAGRYSEFLPEGCASGVAEPQILVDPDCPVVREGRVAAVEPVALSFAVADELARGADPELVRRYAGGLVRLEGLRGLRADEGEGVVGPYGVIRFAETRLEAHNDVAYGDLSGGGPAAPEKSLVFPDPTEFARMIGLIHLDYCTWSLALRDPCADIAPPSGNCAG